MSRCAQGCIKTGTAAEYSKFKPPHACVVPTPAAGGHAKGGREERSSERSSANLCKNANGGITADGMTKKFWYCNRCRLVVQNDGGQIQARLKHRRIVDTAVPMAGWQRASNLHQGCKSRGHPAAQGTGPNAFDVDPSQCGWGSATAGA